MKGLVFSLCICVHVLLCGCQSRLSTEPSGETLRLKNPPPSPVIKVDRLHPQLKAQWERELQAELAKEEKVLAELRERWKAIEEMGLLSLWTSPAEDSAWRARIIADVIRLEAGGPSDELDQSLAVLAMLEEVTPIKNQIIRVERELKAQEARTQELRKELAGLSD